MSLQFRVQALGQVGGAQVDRGPDAAQIGPQMAQRALAKFKAMFGGADFCQRHLPADGQHRSRHSIRMGLELAAEQRQTHGLGDGFEEAPFRPDSIGPGHRRPRRLDERPVIQHVDAGMNVVSLEEMIARDQPMRIAVAFALEQVDRYQQVQRL